MSWITELEKVYDNTITRESDDKPNPIYHIENNASVTVTLDENGNFVKAEKVDKSDRITCMPCTETGASRSSGIDAYPLCDKLEYVYEDTEKCTKYINLLGSWTAHDPDNKKIKAVFDYVSKKSIADDLEKSGIASADVSDFIRWEVEIPGDKKPCLWKDETIQKSWIRFYNSESFDEYCKSNFSKAEDIEKRVRKIGIDYSTGENAQISMYHPAKIRHNGDKAKIISSNDTANYTFRGRFNAAAEACQVSSDSSQKAHSALRWLIKRQGVAVGDGLSLVTWNRAGEKLPSVIESSNDFVYGFGGEENHEDTPAVYTVSEEFAAAMNKCLVGYYGDISNPQNIMIMAISEATPGQGRAAIELYRELQNTDIIAALKRWYNNLSWHISYWTEPSDGEKTGKYVSSIGAPSPKEIAECAYGNRVKGNQVEKTVKRILPCILDGSVIPSDLETQCIKSASNLMIVSASKRNSVLGTACAVYKYNRIVRNKEEYKLALEEKRTSRDYLYGRLLAVAQQLESAALRAMSENRETNAIRYMQQFAMKPAATWKVIYEKKLPAYRRRLEPGLAAWFERKIQDISALFNADDYISEKPLTGEYLLGYQCQLKDFAKKTDGSSENKTEE